MNKYLFIDRDGTLIVEPESKQIDRIEQLILMPMVVPALLALSNAGFQLIMVSNQDGLGSRGYSLSAFNAVQSYLLQLLQSQGIYFTAIKICPHIANARCFCRKPSTGLVMPYLVAMDANHSYVIGDRESDLVFANNIGIKGLQINGSEQLDWQKITHIIISSPRLADFNRVTTETNISCQLNLDSNRTSTIKTGSFFLDHMLAQLAKHAGISLQLFVAGDYHVDDHHVIEDTAIALGVVLKKALGDKWGIARYGFLLPMDESLAQIAIDLAGRAHLVFEGKFARDRISDFSTEMVKHFFKSFSDGLQATLHIRIAGENTHHMIEAIFKGVGRSLRQAIQRIDDTLPSTKGTL